MQIAQLPNWVEWVKALAPTIIAIVALLITAWIQIGQIRTTRAKLKLDLFKDRYELLKIVTSMAKLSNRNTDDFLFEMSKEYDKFRQYGLLFPKRIADKVDELVQCCYEYQGLLQETKDRRGSPEIAEANRKFRESQRKLERLFLDIQTEVADFIRVEWRG